MTFHGFRVFRRDVRSCFENFSRPMSPVWNSVNFKAEIVFEFDSEN